MALDGAFLHCIREELSPLIGSRIDKIHQPSRDTLILSFWTKGGASRVLFSASADAARVHITQTTPENPAQPPMFCMLLRKHLSGGKLEAIEQDGLERILRFRIRANNELGDSVVLTLVAEIMGRFSNVILVNEHGRIIDSLRRVDEEISRVRLVLPATEYSAPPRESRICILDAEDREICSALEQAPAVALSKAVIRIFEGISPIVAREWEFYTGHGAPVTLPLSEELTVRLLVHRTADALRSPQERHFTTVRTKEGQLKDFSFLPIRQYGALMITADYASAGETLDAFFSQRDHFSRMRQRSNDLFRFLVNTSERIAKRVANQKQELMDCAGMELDRRRGDLLSANLYRLNRGDAVARVEDFYEPEMPLTEIPMDVRLTPAQNAQLYYKKYRKACSARKKLTELIEAGEQEQSYIDSVFEALTRAECESDLAQLRLELTEQGYLRENRKQAGMKPPKPMQPLHFRSDDGFDIYVGRNNRQNDQLTLKTAEKLDIWLHTQAVHGAHTIICTNGETPPDRTVEQACMLAAFYSKGRDSAQVRVDYCLVKYVKKPAGARPGMVIYTNYQTAFVTPDADLPERLRVNE